MPRVFAVLIAVVVCSLGSVACEARAQVVPFTLEASGVLANVDPSAYPGVSPGTAYSIKYDLMLDIGAPASIDADQSSWNASGTVTLEIDGQAPIVETSASPMQILKDPFNDGRDFIQVVLNIPGGGFRVLGLLTDPNSDLLSDLSQPPSATLINELPVSPQINSTVAYNERDPSASIVLNGNVTFFTATGGAPPPAPVITSEPEGDIVDSGDSVGLAVVAQGFELSYQWFKDGVPLTDGPGVSGSDTSRLALTATENARYECVVTNPGGSATSSEVIVAVNNTCPADQNNDGMLSPTDFTAWIANYNAGC